MATLLEVALGAALGVAVLLLAVLAARRAPSVSEQAVADRVLASLQDHPHLRLLPELKEGHDANVPHIKKVVEDIRKAGQELDKALVAVGKDASVTPGIQQKVVALEQQVRRLEGIEENVQRLTRTFAGSGGRGRGGEAALRAVFAALPNDLWSEQEPLGGGKVDFVVRMKNGRVLPIDSKTSGVTAVEAFLDAEAEYAAAEDESSRAAAAKELSAAQTKVGAAVVVQAKKVRDYIRPDEGTLTLALQAVPDPVYAACGPDVRNRTAQLHVHVVPYSLLGPVVDVLRSQNMVGDVDAQAVVDALQGVSMASREVEKVLVNKFEQAAKRIDSGIKEIRSLLGTMERQVDAVGPQD